MIPASSFGLGTRDLPLSLEEHSTYLNQFGVIVSKHTRQKHGDVTTTKKMGNQGVLERESRTWGREGGGCCDGFAIPLSRSSVLSS